MKVDQSSAGGNNQLFVGKVDRLSGSNNAIVRKKETECLLTEEIRLRK